jgi:ribosomal protein S18 acetylase RimI-like enzyme
VPDVSEDLDLPFPHYRCPTCRTELPLSDARVTVTCAEHVPAGEKLVFEIRDATTADRRAVEEICDRAWGETDVDLLGRTFDVMAGENVIAVVDDDLAGLVSLAVHRGELVIVMQSVYPQFQGTGIGSALVEEAARRAAARNLPSVVVTTTNDDIPSLYFYQRQGFSIYEVATGAMADRLGAAVPGFAEIPIRDEVRLRRPACRP